MDERSLTPPYIPLIQKPTCCAVTCLQMILYRNNFGLYDQEELAIAFGVKINADNASAFSSAMPIMTKTNFDEGISTVESADKINSFFEKWKLNLYAQSFKYTSINILRDFIKENLQKNNDLWIEYHAHEIHQGDEKNGIYIHDGLIESMNLDTNTVTIIDPMPKHKQRIIVSLGTVERSISTEFGKETGFIVILKGKRKD